MHILVHTLILIIMPDFRCLVSGASTVLLIPMHQRVTSGIVKINAEVYEKGNIISQK